MFKFAATCIAGLLLSGCATIMHGGGSQTIGVSSTPSGATVAVDNVERGVTPLSVELKRNQPHTLVFSLEGYDGASATTSKKVSGWVWGNIVFGGLIGLVVDFASGGVYNIVPENVHADLAKAPVST